MSDHDPYAAPEAELGVTPPESAPPTEKLNPWFAIWTRPRAVMRQLMWDHTTGMVLLLAAVQGFADTLNQFAMRSAGDQFSMPTMFLIAAIGGSIGGIVTLYLFGFLLRWTGNWLGGQGTDEDIRAAYAYSAIPVIWAMLLWLPELALFGEELFTTETPRLNENPLLWQALIGFGVLEGIIGIWAFVVFLKCLGEVQRFSAWRALGNAVVASLVLVLPFVLLGFVIAAIIGFAGG